VWTKNLPVTDNFFSKYSFDLTYILDFVGSFQLEKNEILSVNFNKMKIRLSFNADFALPLMALLHFFLSVTSYWVLFALQNTEIYIYIYMQMEMLVLTYILTTQCRTREKENKFVTIWNLFIMLNTNWVKNLHNIARRNYIAAGATVRLVLP
jgi:hypothetical protein